MRRWYGAAVLVAACGGAGAVKVQPANTASSAIKSFMRAVADSNLDAMAELWGTARGPAGRTHQPPDYQRRVSVIQTYLTSDDFRILSDEPDGSDARHAVQVQLRRQACTWTVPFTTIRLTDGTWIVNQVDLTTAGNPARSCNPSAQSTDSTAH